MPKLKCHVAEYGVIVNKKQEFLILSLPASKKYPREAWMLPGGRLHTDDQPEKGLQREIKEETNLKVKVIGPLSVARYGQEKPAKYVVYFLCQLMGSQKVKLSQEHNNFQWASFKDLEKIKFHNINSKLALQKAKIFFYNI